MFNREPLKVLTIAFKEMELAEFNGLMQKYNHDVEDEGFRDEIERELIYIATFGLSDPIREKAMINVEMIKYGFELGTLQNIDNEAEIELPQEVNVRMLSGDHIETCRLVAYKTGIITQEEMYDD